MLGVSSFLTGFCGQCFISKGPRDRCRLVSDNVLQDFTGDVEPIELAVDIQFGGGGLIDWLANNVACVGVSVSAVPACVFLNNMASTFL